MTFAEAEALLLDMPSFAAIGEAAYAPGLDRIKALMDGMGDPHRTLRVAHVAGTNGKGSTCSMLASIGTAAGLKVGLHTSPHLYRMNERMRIDGTSIPDERLAGLVGRWAGLFGTVRPSFFEATVALSLLYFAEEGVDVAVVEVGLGGRLDATNVVEPAVCAITSIGRDHTAILGDSIAEIAAEKAGIAKAGVPLLCAAEQPEALAEIRRIARLRGAPIHVLDEETALDEVEATREGNRWDLCTPVRTYVGLGVPLPGRFQFRNATLAVRAAEFFYRAAVSESGRAVYEGLRHVRRYAGLRGRLEVLETEPLIVQDVGHNLDGLSASLAFMNEQKREGGRLFVAFGVMRDKDVEGMARLLGIARARVLLIPVDAARAMPPSELAVILSRHVETITSCDTVGEAVAQFRRQAAPRDALLITGSHYVASQVDARD
jgi:dihydrofolate synthase/folylpolyglutamate synthase